MSVTVEFTFDIDEHLRAVDAVRARTRVAWSTRVGGLLFLGIGVLMTLVAIGDQRSASGVVANAVPWVFLGATWAFLLPALTRWSARRMVSRDPSIQGPQRRFVDESGFHSVGNGVALDVPWHVMARVRETEEFFLFYYNKQCAYYLAKSRLGVSPKTS